ncbi:MAG: type IV pilus secretin PilQ [Thermodesulfobacteria bacterium]|nr:type IV pilus secretin PilQ [Thermodesulfobacteriota bacterium]
MRKLIILIFLILMPQLVFSQDYLYLKNIIYSKTPVSSLIFEFSARPEYKVFYEKRQLKLVFVKTLPETTSWLENLPKDIFKEVRASFKGDNLVINFKFKKPFNFQLIPTDTQLVVELLWKGRKRPTNVVIKREKVETLEEKTLKELENIFKQRIKYPNYKIFTNTGEIKLPLTKKKYRGFPISVDFQDADIHAVFRMLAEIGGINIIVSDKVKGRVTLRAKDVPWDLVMDAILAEFGLAKIKVGNIIRIATIQELNQEMNLYKNYVQSLAQTTQGLRAEIEAKKRILESIQELEETKNILVTKIYHLKYIRVDKLVDYLKNQTLTDKLRELLQNPNRITSDALTNTLIVKATPKIIDEIDKIIKNLDRPRPQILIEARIVEINDNYMQNLGIKWGLAAWEANDHTVWGVSSDSSVTPGTITYSHPSGSVNIQSSTVNLQTSPAVVDLGAPSATSALGLMLGYFGETSGVLDMQLSALQQQGVGRIISKPSILTLNDEPATIQQGYKIPYLKLAANMQTATTDFIDAGLKLTVIPSLTPNGNILLDITIEKSTPDWAHTVNGVPAISTSTIQTSVIVKNGQTLVLGGIKIKDISNIQDEVPGLAKLPLIGGLFKRKAKNLTDRELLIFITPKVVSYPVKGVDY